MLIIAYIVSSMLAWQASAPMGSVHFCCQGQRRDGRCCCDTLRPDPPGGAQLPFKSRPQLDTAGPLGSSCAIDSFPKGLLTACTIVWCGLIMSAWWSRVARVFCGGPRWKRASSQVGPPVSRSWRDPCRDNLTLSILLASGWHAAASLVFSIEASPRLSVADSGISIRLFSLFFLSLSMATSLSLASLVFPSACGDDASCRRDINLLIFMSV